MALLFSLVTDAYAMGPGPQAGAQGGAQSNMLVNFMPFALIFVVFYFLLIRPQQKQAKQHKEMLDNLKRGDKVITGGGIYGVVDTVTDNSITVKIAENVKIKVGKQSIAALRSSSDDD